MSLRNELRDISERQTQILDELKVIRGDAKDTTFGQRCADWISCWLGSWTFILSQAGVMVAWIILNTLQWTPPFDKFPFRLLNLVLSLQAAFAVPVILMSQNRQEQKDRRRAMEAYRAIERIERLMVTLDENVEQAKRKHENGEES